MKCKMLYVGKNSIGDRYDDESVFVFFSNRSFTEKEFSRIFPERRLVFNKQTHSDTIHLADEGFVSSAHSGDALITNVTNLAIGIYSADCLPVLIHDPIGKKVASIHAGWRGIEQEIIIKAITALNPSQPETLRAWIGPHIKRDTFEVQSDVAERLQRAHKAQSQVVFKHITDETKRYVDLEQIASSQLQSCGLLLSNIWNHPTNTYSDLNYYSYRRDGSTGRLISFICLQA